jgi:hypothetical protein
VTARVRHGEERSDETIEMRAIRQIFWIASLRSQGRQKKGGPKPAFVFGFAS